MPEGQITDAKELLARVQSFGGKLRERRRFARQTLQWAAKIEIRGRRFEGMILDLSAGGARIRFDAAVAAGDELILVLKELDALGARVVWQREGEAGLQFLLAPELVAERVQRLTGWDAPTGGAPVGVKPVPARRRRYTAMIAACGAALLIGGSAFVADSLGHVPPPVLAITGGATGQHGCESLMNRLTGATNQIDFTLRLADAAQAKCVDLQHLAGSDSDLRGHMTHATKVPLR